MVSVNKGRKVFIIGLDGAAFEVILPMARRGRLPAFARLMRKGAFGHLKSAIPPITPYVWTSLGTGKAPSKRGLHGFRRYGGKACGKKGMDKTFLRAKYLWKILSEAGKRSVVIDVPFTYPPEKIDGVMISRAMAPAGKNHVYPQPLCRRLMRSGDMGRPRLKITGSWEADDIGKKREECFLGKRERGGESAKRGKISQEKNKKDFMRITADIEKNAALAGRFMSEENWDFFMIVFASADNAGRAFWKDRARVKKVYEKLDWAIKRLFARSGAGTVKFVLSGHGFTSSPYSFNVNEWLYRKGLLFKRRDTASGIAADYSKSEAYFQSGASYGVRINLAGRDKAGMITVDEYDGFRDYLTKELSKVRHPMTGKRIFAGILKKEDIYSGGAFDMPAAPDILLFPEGMNVRIEGQFTPEGRVFGGTGKGYGSHNTRGVLFAEGKGIKNLKLDSPDITDIVPTVLHIMNVPLPNDLDGKVLSGMFAPRSSFAQRPILYQRPSGIAGEEGIYSEAEEEKVRQRLEALGYMG